MYGHPGVVFALLGQHEGDQVKIVRHGSRARIAAVGFTAAGALLAGCAAANESAPAPAGGAPSAGAPAALAGTIAGAGASSQQAAQEAWIAGFNGANPDATITYDPSGSGAGRTQFLGGGVAFAGSDAAMKDDEIAKGKTRCNGDVVEVPAYVSPIAVIFNVQGVTDLNLAPDTIAKIFDKKITKWNDPAIAADNAGATLPDLAITPVNRSDKSGTTQNFTDYLKVAAAASWSYDVSDTWPVQGGEAAQGTSGVVGAVKAGNGAIGYADESQAKGISQAKVKVGTDFVGPTPEAAAAVLEASTRVEGQGDNIFAYKLARDTTASATYPVVLASYLIACTKYPDAATADLVKAYLTYVVSADGQKVAADTAGAAPLSDGLRSQITPAIDGIAGGS
jgi:phosphate transport system substrate-binding protein